MAEVEFARWLGQTLDAATRLEGHAGLTAPASTFYRRSSPGSPSGSGGASPRTGAELAEMIRRGPLACWRLRNLLPDRQADVAETSAELPVGPAVPPRRCSPTVHPDASPPVTSGLTSFTGNCAIPAEFAAEARCPDPIRTSPMPGETISGRWRGYLGQIKD